MIPDSVTRKVRIAASRCFSPRKAAASPPAIVPSSSSGWSQSDSVAGDLTTDALLGNASDYSGEGSDDDSAIVSLDTTGDNPLLGVDLSGDSLIHADFGGLDDGFGN